MILKFGDLPIGCPFNTPGVAHLPAYVKSSDTHHRTRLNADYPLTADFECEVDEAILEQGIFSLPFKDVPVGSLYGFVQTSLIFIKTGDETYVNLDPKTHQYVGRIDAVLKSRDTVVHFIPPKSQTKDTAVLSKKTFGDLSIGMTFWVSQDTRTTPEYVKVDANGCSTTAQWAEKRTRTYMLGQDFVVYVRQPEPAAPTNPVPFSQVPVGHTFQFQPQNTPPGDLAHFDYVKANETTAVFQDFKRTVKADWPVIPRGDLPIPASHSKAHTLIAMYRASTAAKPTDPVRPVEPTKPTKPSLIHFREVSVGHAFQFNEGHQPQGSALKTNYFKVSDTHAMFDWITRAVEHDLPVIPMGAIEPTHRNVRERLGWTTFGDLQVGSYFVPQGPDWARFPKDTIFRKTAPDYYTYDVEGGSRGGSRMTADIPVILRDRPTQSPLTVSSGGTGVKTPDNLVRYADLPVGACFIPQGTRWSSFPKGAVFEKTKETVCSWRTEIMQSSVSIDPETMVTPREKPSWFSMAEAPQPPTKPLPPGLVPFGSLAVGDHLRFAEPYIPDGATNRRDYRKINNETAELLPIRTNEPVSRKVAKEWPVVPIQKTETTPPSQPVIPIPTEANPTTTFFDLHTGSYFFLQGTVQQNRPPEAIFQKTNSTTCKWWADNGAAGSLTISPQVHVVRADPLAWALEKGHSNAAEPPSQPKAPPEYKAETFADRPIRGRFWLVANPDQGSSAYMKITANAYILEDDDSDCGLPHVYLANPDMHVTRRV